MSEINFFWDPLSDNILQERDETGSVTAEYTAEPGLYGNIISQNRGGVESQFHYDAQGSTLAVTDDNQNATDTFAYTAFGEVTERTGNTEVPFQYIGQKAYYTDSLTGQIMARRRRYAPAHARWTVRDPLSSRRSLRLLPYVYAQNAPLTNIDPSGEYDVKLSPPINEGIACIPGRVVSDDIVFRGRRFTWTYQWTEECVLDPAELKCPTKVRPPPIENPFGQRSCSKELIRETVAATTFYKDCLKVGNKWFLHIVRLESAAEPKVISAKKECGLCHPVDSQTQIA
jgi:RHS repeat-associated protein